MCHHVNKSYIWNLPHLFTLWFNNVKFTKFLFSYVLYCKLKEISMWNQYYHFFDLSKIRVGWALTTKLPLPYLGTVIIAPVLSKEFLEIQTTIECRFTLKCILDMIITSSQLNCTDKYSQQSSVSKPVRLNGWELVYKLSGVGSNPAAGT